MIRQSRQSDRFAFLHAMTWSAFVHLCGVAALLAIVSIPDHPTAPRDVRRAPAAAPIPIARLVFLPAPGVGRGGGGGGNQQPGPIRRAEGVGTAGVTVRIAKPVPPPTAAAAPVADVPAPLPALLLEALPLASGVKDLIGLPSGGVPDGISTGPGSGGGVGTGTGTGLGAGSGPGLGEGSGGGTGGGVYRPGGAVSAPQLISEIRPTYTAEALERRVQGSVVLELVVTNEGRPSHIRVVRSLDAGLDDRAVKAVEAWRFAPGRVSGQPVNVMVTVVLDFTIH